MRLRVHGNASKRRKADGRRGHDGLHHGARRRLAQSLLVSALALLALATAPRLHAATPTHAAAPHAARDTLAGEDMAWAVLKTEDGYVLRYGTPHEGNPPFSATCQMAAGLLQFTLEVKSPKVHAGEGVPLTFTAGTRRLELAAATFRGADRSLVVGAAVTLNGRTLDLLGAGETLHVVLPGLSERIPLAGAQAKLADFKRACLPLRQSEYRPNTF